MTRRRPLPPPLADRPFHVAEARAAGVSRCRLVARDLLHPHHGGRAHTVDSVADRCAALVPLLSPTQAFTGPTAASLLGAPLPRRLEGDTTLYVSSLRPQRAMRRPGVVGSERADGAIVPVRGMPVLAPELSWIDLARRLSAVDLIAVADRFVSGTLREAPACTVDDLARGVEHRAGAPGVARARSVLPYVRTGAWSRPETFLRLLIGAAGLPEPVLNAPIRLRGGRVVVPDLCWPTFRVIVEYDGRWHDATWDADADRHELLVDDDWLIVRVRRQELFHDPGTLLGRLVRRLRERGFRLDRAIDLTRMPRFIA